MSCPFPKSMTHALIAEVLVAGGSPLAQAATSELYDLTTQTWTNSGALNAGREFPTETLLADDSVMVAGGQTDSRLLASTEIFDDIRPSARRRHFSV
jgi:hypothetical protein